jgi:hypothetical protein
MSRDSILVRLSWCVAAAMLVGWWASSGPPLNQPAAADMIATNGGFTLMTANSRDQRVNEESEVLYVLIIAALCWCMGFAMYRANPISRCLTVD